MFFLPAWLIPTDPPVVVKPTSDPPSRAEIFAQEQIDRSTKFADEHRFLFFVLRALSSILALLTPILLLISNNPSWRVYAAITSGLSAFFITVDSLLQNEKLWLKDRSLAFSVADELNEFRLLYGVYNNNKLDPVEKQKLLAERVNNLISGGIQGWLQVRNKPDKAVPIANGSVGEQKDDGQ